MKVFQKLTIVVLYSLFLGNCIRFKVENYKPDLISKIKIGEGLQFIEGSMVNNVITNIPVTIPVFSRRIFVTDFKNSMIKVFDFGGQLDYAIGNQPVKTQIKTKILPNKFGGLGFILPAEKDEIYVQNRISAKDQLPKKTIKETPYTKYSGNFEVTEDGNIPSYIFKLNNKGATEYMIGVSGLNSEPFRYIEKIYAFDDGNLYAYHKVAEEMRLSHYVNGELNSTLKEGGLSIFSGEDSKKYKIKIENMIPHGEDKYALVSASYFNKNDYRFQFRRIYKYYYKNEKPETLLTEIQDPSEMLFALKKNGEFYIWETEDNGNSVKLQVHNKEGNHVNNIRLSYTPPRGQWRETYTDQDDNIYSIRIRNGFLEIYQWK
ncbi:MAG: hypothetical protein L6Q54_00690 [Leptospiraceae bacterium]|nr:hypothetical protein [Leptospiraceae bacterium]MCK6379754.1 hypothetical protein [Leptospiraceae bacterium]NUM40414.1 hypothetical protein [Leptospiraceae bacterium]